MHEFFESKRSRYSTSNSELVSSSLSTFLIQFRNEGKFYISSFLSVRSLIYSTEIYPEQKMGETQRTKKDVEAAVFGSYQLDYFILFVREQEGNLTPFFMSNILVQVKAKRKTKYIYLMYLFVYQSLLHHERKMVFQFYSGKSHGIPLFCV